MDVSIHIGLLDAHPYVFLQLGRVEVLPVLFKASHCILEASAGGI